MSQSRSPTIESTRIPALCVPALLLAYGILRFVDRIGGTDESGPLWVAGHLCFLGAIVGVAVLDVLLWRSLGQSLVTDTADVLGLAGSAAFVWVIVGDISPSIHSELPVPGPVTALGPPAFLLGIFMLLGVAALRAQFPWPHWILVVVGFSCVAASLALLPLAAVLLLVGFEPLRSHQRLIGERPTVDHRR
ncbi:hypothetical protein [Flexivirga endophytica]|nr:hypothetical protein [Flexivirga endophytica]